MGQCREMFRAVISGSRKATSQKRVNKALKKYKLNRVATGDASGIDAFVEAYCSKHKIKHVKYAASWKRYGKKAGPIRNKFMLENEVPDFVLVFNGGGRGTADLDCKATLMNYRCIRDTGHPKGYKLLVPLDPSLPNRRDRKVKSTGGPSETVIT